MFSLWAIPLSAVFTLSDKRDRSALRAGLGFRVHLLHSFLWHQRPNNVKYQLLRLRCSQSFELDVVILELGSNDLTPKDVRPETVGSDLADLVAHLFKVTNKKQIFICLVLHREQLPRRSYNLDVDKLNKYLKAVISDIPNARYWRHRGMLLPSQEVLAADRVHVNDHGQYLLYPSCRGAVIQSLKSLGLALAYQELLKRQVHKHIYQLPLCIHCPCHEY